MRTGDYVVEVIGKGRKRGTFKAFRSRQNANRYAKREVAKGKGISIDRLTQNGQHGVATKNLKVTALGEGKFGKEFVKDFGSLRTSAKKHKRKKHSRSSQSNDVLSAPRWW